MSAPAPLPSKEHTGSSKARQIIDAARLVFFEDGYGAASMDRIARQAGVSKATLYAHYTSKEALFAAVVTAECTMMADALFEPGFDNADVRKTLTRLGMAFTRMIFDDVKLAGYRIIVAEAQRFPELGRTFYDAGPRRILTWITDYLSEANARGLLNVPNPRIAASQFLGMIKADNYLRSLFDITPTPSDPTIPQIVDAAVDTFMRAFGPESTPAAAGDGPA